jgi:hypothetical protein
VKRLVFVFLLLAASALSAQERMSDLDQAYEDARVECNALKDLEARREQEREPLPGERIGTVAGKSRLTAKYFERQAMLEQDLESARERCEQATKRWNDLK